MFRKDQLDCRVENSWRVGKKSGKEQDQLKSISLVKKEMAMAYREVVRVDTDTVLRFSFIL